MRRRFVVWVVLLALAGCSSQPTPEPSGGGDTAPVISAAVSLQYVDAPAGDVLTALGERIGRQVEVSSEVTGQVTVSLHDVPWDHALDAILQALDLRAAWRGATLRVGPEPEGQPFRVHSRSSAPLSPAAGVPRLDGARTDIGRLLLLLAAYSRTNLVMVPGLRGEATVWLEHCSLRRLIESVAAVLRIPAQERNGIIVVGGRPGWGSRDLDDEPEALPRHPAPARNRLQGRGVPVLPWLRLLASYTDRDVVLLPGISGRTDVDLRDVPYPVALRQAAGKHRLRVAQRGGLTTIGPWPTPIVRAAAHEPLRVTLPDDSVVEVQATLIDHQDPALSVVLVSGRVYRSGDGLADSSRIRVRRITGVGVELQVQGQRPWVVPFPQDRVERH